MRLFRLVSVFALLVFVIPYSVGDEFYVSDDTTFLLQIDSGHNVSVLRGDVTPSIINISPDAAITFWDYSSYVLRRISAEGDVDPILALEGNSGYDWDAEGNLYITDGVNRNLRKYDSVGNMLWRVDDTKIGHGLVVGIDGMIYVGAAGGHQVYIFDSNGVKMAQSLDAGSSNPSPHFIDDNHTLWATSGSDGKVLKSEFVEGSYTDFVEFASEVWWASDVLVSTAGLVYAVSTFPGSPGIFVFNPDGSLSEKIESPLFSYPRSIDYIPDVDSDGDSIYDQSGNCPLISNPDQADLDGSGRGDVCDAFPPGC